MTTVRVPFNGSVSPDGDVTLLCNVCMEFIALDELTHHAAIHFDGGVAAEWCERRDRAREMLDQEVKL